MTSLRVGDGLLTVLCLGAHPDDIEIGCGGTLLELHTRPRTTVRGLVLTGTPDRREEARSAFAMVAPGAVLDVLDHPDGHLPAHWDDVKTALERLATECSPDVILAPRPDDAHQDHRLLGQLVRTVWRNALVLHYEIPKWDADLLPPTHYVALTEAQARRKVEVLNTAYPSQRSRDWWDDELFLGLMRLRGIECRSRYAEAFHVGKAVIDLTGSRGVTP